MYTEEMYPGENRDNKELLRLKAQEQSCVPKWTTAAGEKIPITEMGEAHLMRSALHLLKKDPHHPFIKIFYTEIGNRARLRV